MYIPNTIKKGNFSLVQGQKNAIHSTLEFRIILLFIVTYILHVLFILLHVIAQSMTCRDGKSDLMIILRGIFHAITSSSIITMQVE